MKEKLIFIGNNGKGSMKVLYPKISNNVKLIQRKQFVKSGNFYIKEYLDTSLTKFKKIPINDFNLNNKIVVRWGNRIEIEKDERSIIYNDNQQARKASNKKLAREIFIKNNILCPQLLTPKSDNLKYPIIARPNEHSKGENFVVINNLKEFETHYNTNNIDWYYSEFIDKEREFRVHCGHGKILAIMEKPKGEGIAWNRVLNEDPFVRVKQEEYKYKLFAIALQAMKVIGLDFGGVDIMLKGDTPYVIEINTSPSIENSEYVNDRYSKYFNWLFSSETKREHWNFKEFTAGKSLAWKENQFN